MLHSFVFGHLLLSDVFPRCLIKVYRELFRPFLGVTNLGRFQTEGQDGFPIISNWLTMQHRYFAHAQPSELGSNPFLFREKIAFLVCSTLNFGKSTIF